MSHEGKAHPRIRSVLSSTDLAPSASNIASGEQFFWGAYSILAWSRSCHGRLSYQTRRCMHGMGEPVHTVTSYRANEVTVNLSQFQYIANLRPSALWYAQASPRLQSIDPNSVLLPTARLSVYVPCNFPHNSNLHEQCC